METYKQILLASLILIILYFIFKIIRKNNTTITPNITDLCDQPDCKGKSKDCSILSENTLTQCDISVKDSCYECFGNMTCQNVNNGISKDIITTVTKKEDCPKNYKWDDQNNICYIENTMNLKDKNEQNCNSPYIWDQNTQTCKIQNGSYCLPHNIPEIECNEFTGTKVLGKVHDHSPYEWFCICKDDTQFTNDGNPLSDCNHIRKCGIDGKKNEDSKYRKLIYKLNDNPSCTCTNKDGTTPHEGDLWDPVNSCWDPFICSQCKCASSEINVNDNCAYNSCKPFCEISKTNPTQVCDCPLNNGYVDCFTLTQKKSETGSIFNTSQCQIPGVIPDPCYPGYYDPYKNNGIGGCVCDGENPNLIDDSGSNNYVSVPVPNSVTGEMCINWCKTGNNPCGNRGTCYVKKDSPQSDKKIEFKFIYINNDPKDKYFLIQSSNGTNNYININSNNELTISKTGAKFYLFNNTQNLQLETLKDRNVFLLANINNNITSYLNIKNNKFTMMQNKQQASPLTFIASKEYSELNILGKISTTGVNCIGNESNNDGTYKITEIINIENKPICKNCKNPYRQSPELYCNYPCLLAGQKSDKTVCCSDQLINCSSYNNKSDPNCANSFTNYTCKGGLEGEVNNIPADRPKEV